MLHSMVGVPMTLLAFFKKAGGSPSPSPAPQAGASGSPAAQPQAAPPTPTAAAVQPQAAGSKKKLSSNPDAVRKRREREAQRSFKRAKAARREKAAADAEKAAPAEPQTPVASKSAASNTEKETHYVDPRGRKRKRKTVRTRALESGELGGTQRRWTPSERELVVAFHLKMGKPEFGRVANELHRLHPTMFGPGSPGKPKGISRQDVRSWASLETMP